jgi:hypothetical protein
MAADMEILKLADDLYADKTRGELRNFNELMNNLMADFGRRGVLGSTVAFQQVLQAVRQHIEGAVASYISAVEEACTMLGLMPSEQEQTALIAKGLQILNEQTKRASKACEKRFPAHWTGEFQQINTEEKERIEFRLGSLLNIRLQRNGIVNAIRDALNQGPADQSKKQYDAFICHASEDKDEIVRPLAELLKRMELEIWFDEFELSIGDSLRRKIDRGLASSRFGVVILSEAFFKKEWPQRELDGLVSGEVEGRQVILPIWHKITKEQVYFYSPPLADKFALRTDLYSIEEIACKLAEKFNVCLGRSPKPPLGQPQTFASPASSGLSENAARIARFLNERSEYGLTHDPMFFLDEISRQLSLPITEVEIAADVLESDGYIFLDRSITHSPQIWPQYRLYWETDAQVKGWVPRDDAIALATALVNNPEESVGLDALAQKSGWPVRRINPAATYLAEHGIVEVFECCGVHPYA